MLDAVASAPRKADRARRAESAPRVDVRDRYSRLTAREREVTRLVAAGRMNKRIVAMLAISEPEVKSIAAPQCAKWRPFHGQADKDD
jgi:FixJ family two-component response regulator